MLCHFSNGGAGQGAATLLAGGRGHDDRAAAAGSAGGEGCRKGL